MCVIRTHIYSSFNLLDVYIPVLHRFSFTSYTYLICYKYYLITFLINISIVFYLDVYAVTPSGTEDTRSDVRDVETDLTVERSSPDI